MLKVAALTTQAKSDKIDTSAVLKRFKAKLNQVKERQHPERHQQSLNTIENKSMKFNDLDFFEKNSLIIEMIAGHSEDYVFKQQMKAAHKDTKEFINSIIRVFQMNDLNRMPRSPKQILVDRQNEINRLLA